MGDWKGRYVTDAQVNVRGLPPLVLDGVPFPYHIDKAFGAQVEVNDANVHLVKIAIQVDRSVTINDLSELTLPALLASKVADPSERLKAAALREQQAQQELAKAREEAAAAMRAFNEELLGDG